MGSGKTVEGAYIAIQCAKQKHPVLIVVLKATARQWETTLSSLAHTKPNVHIIFHNNYLLREITKFIDTNHGKAPVIIFDEFHLIVSSASSQNKSSIQLIRLLCQAKIRLLMLSGTPLMNYPSEIRLYAALMSPYDSVLGGRVMNYECHLSNVLTSDVEKELLKQFINPKCVSVLNPQRYAFYESIKSYTKDFPSKQVRLIYLNMSSNQRAIHDVIAKHEKKTPDGGFRQLSRYVCNYCPTIDPELKLTQIIRQLHQERQEYTSKNSPKFDYIARDILRHRSKSLIYIYSIENIKQCVRYLSDAIHDVRIFVYTGSTSDAERRRGIDAYNKNEIDVIIVSDAGSVGLDLKETMYVYVASIAWNDSSISQVIGRSIRYKSHQGKQTVQVVIVMMKDSSDSEIFEIAKAKYEACHSIIQHIIVAPGPLKLTRKLDLIGYSTGGKPYYMHSIEKSTMFFVNRRMASEIVCRYGNYISVSDMMELVTSSLYFNTPCKSRLIFGKVVEYRVGVGLMKKLTQEYVPILEEEVKKCKSMKCYVTLGFRFKVLRPKSNYV